MALAGLIFGSLIGTVAGLVGWLGFDLGALQAFGLYMACGLALGTLGAVAAWRRNDENAPASGAVLETAA